MSVGVSFAGVLFPPVIRDCIGCPGQPFLISAELAQCLDREELGAVAGWMAERFQEPGSDQHRDLVGLKTKIPRRLSRVEAGRLDLPRQELRPFTVHTL